MGSPDLLDAGRDDPGCAAGGRATGGACQRRVAHLRRRPRQHQVLAARSDRRRQLRRSGDRLALAVGRRLGQPDDPGRGRVAGPIGRRLRGPGPGGSRPLARPPVALHEQPQGDAADGRRPHVHQHADLAGRRRRCRHRGDPLGLQPEDLRSGHHHDVRALESARRRLLDRRVGGTHLLGHEQRFSALCGSGHRAPLRRFRRERPPRPHPRPPPRGPGRPGLAECPALFGAVAAAGDRRHHHHAVVHLVVQHHAGGPAGVGCGDSTCTPAAPSGPSTRFPRATSSATTPGAATRGASPGRSGSGL